VSWRSPHYRRFWKHSPAHFVRKGFRGTHDDFSRLCILFDEWRHEFIKESENIVADQHLAVALETGSDAVGGIFSREVTSLATESGWPRALTRIFTGV